MVRVKIEPEPEILDALQDEVDVEAEINEEGEPGTPDGQHEAAAAAAAPASEQVEREGLPDAPAEAVADAPAEPAAPPLGGEAAADAQADLAAAAQAQAAPKPPRCWVEQHKGRCGIPNCQFTHLTKAHWQAAGAGGSSGLGGAMLRARSSMCSRCSKMVGRWTAGSARGETRALCSLLWTSAR
jgi:hypothetical protein